MILVTGGCGYIGSHIVVLLLQAGYEVVVVDSLVNSSKHVIKKIHAISGKEILFYQIDITNEYELASVFKQHNITAVMHLAGLKAVGESVANALYYYKNNVGGLFSLLTNMQQYGCHRIIFSSSATVYGEPTLLPMPEHHTLSPQNPYGRTKLIQEQLLQDLADNNHKWKITVLRYFNPIGAHDSGLIGESPQGVPNNLMPYLTQVAVGRLKKLVIYGDDYKTYDGTGVRDYLHVIDLAKAHLKALNCIDQQSSSIEIYNLGTGTGVSVLDIVKTFERVTKLNIPYEISHRRAGDVAECYCDPKRAQQYLGWRTELSLNDMVQDSWRWQSMNPEGIK